MYTDPNDDSRLAQIVRQKIALGTYGYEPKEGEKFPAPDDNTDEAVLARQQKALAAGKPTYKECKTIIKKGCEGDNVEMIQKLLGFKGSDVDRKFWTKTKKAVQAFQISKGLKPDGIVGEETMKALVDARRKQTTDRTSEETGQGIVGADERTQAATSGTPAGPAAAPATATTASPATSGSGPKYAGVPPGSNLEKMLDRTEDQRGKPENERLTFNDNRVWRSQIGNSNYGPGSPKEKLAKVIKAALLQKGFLEKPYNPNLLEESLTINQRKLNEAKSLFERLKKVL